MCVTEARPHIRSLWDCTCHLEAIAERSQKVDETLKQVQGDKNVSKAPGNHNPHSTHFTHYTHAKRAAFTLAEVLITLAIIGIVAAMTIPTLVQSYKKKVVESRLLKFYSTMQQAIKLSEIENGPLSTWDDIGTGCEFVDPDAEEKECIEGTETPLIWYNKYLAKYIKISQKPLTDLSDNNLTSAGIYFPDGSYTSISGEGWNYFISPSNKRRQFGVTIFPFKFYKDKGLQPYFNEINPAYWCNENGNGANCTKVIMENGWKIPEDYPYKF